MITSFADISLLLLDVDGTLTEGTVIYNDRGEETKVFSVRDGLGLRLLMDAGVDVGIITGRSAPALLHRLKNLGIRHIWDGVRDKADLLGEITKKTGVEPYAMAFVGDDLPDLGLMALVGLSIAVADAAPEVIERADYTTRAPGGKGAVREVAELILKGKNLWSKIVDSYLL